LAGFLAVAMSREPWQFKGLDSGAKVLKSWGRWMKTAGVAHDGLTAAEARESLEKLLAHLKQRYNGRGTLPWCKRPT
jgi:hypothetical protein